MLRTSRGMFVHKANGTNASVVLVHQNKRKPQYNKSFVNKIARIDPGDKIIFLPIVAACAHFPRRSQAPIAIHLWQVQPTFPVYKTSAYISRA